MTLSTGDAVRTGVTAIVPHAGNVFQQKVAGAVFVGNAFGKLAGSTQVDELGAIETPIVLTNTLGVGAAIEGVVRWTLAQPGNEQVRSVNALVGETNDSGLNDIRGLHVRPDHVVEAIRVAKAGTVDEGSVGAGTGTQAFGWKGGIGTSSRRLTAAMGGYTVGVLVQSNYGGVLTMGGAPVEETRALRLCAVRSRRRRRSRRWILHGGGRHRCAARRARPQAVGRWAIFGLARTGSSYSNGSGDFAIAFTTHASQRVTFGAEQPATRTAIPTDGVSPLFQAALEATEEAVYNSLLRATTVTSRGTTVEALPIDRVRAILQKSSVAVSARSASRPPASSTARPCARRARGCRGGSRRAPPGRTGPRKPFAV